MWKYFLMLGWLFLVWGVLDIVNGSQFSALGFGIYVLFSGGVAAALRL